MPDLSDDDINRSDNKGMDYSMHIHTRDIAGGRRSSHITTFYKDSHEDPKESSTPKTQGQQTTEPGTSGEPSTTAAKPTH